MIVLEFIKLGVSSAVHYWLRNELADGSATEQMSAIEKSVGGLVGILRLALNTRQTSTWSLRSM